MFQYATLFSLAKRRGFDFVIPHSWAAELSHEHQLFAAFELSSARCAGITRNLPRKEAVGFHYDEALAETCPDNVDLYGYFQSQKYFIDAAAAVRDEFIFQPAIVAEADERLAAVAGSKISLHVRRGDYLRAPHLFPTCKVDYYARALQRLPPELPVVIFSDDIAWCRTQDIFRGNRFVFSENASNVTDLRMMSLCDHHIIANSSFSWWGAWLGRNPDKVVIAPERWFGPGYAQLDTRDLLPETWLKVA